MAVSIQDELGVINKQVTDLQRNANTAADKVKKLGEELKFDPKNIQTMKDRLTALNDEVKKYTEYQDALKVKQQKLQQQLTAQQSQKAALSEDSEEYAKLERQIAKTSDQLSAVERKIKSADNTLEKLSNTTKLYNKQLEATQKQLKVEKLKNFDSALGNFQKTVTKFQVALVALIGTITKLTTQAIEQATELYTLSKRYETTAENIQQCNKALQLATGDTDLFTESLKVMSKGLSTIPVGRGVAYQNALRGIGIAFKDIQDLDPAEQFNRILDGLQNVANESLQSSYALTLFGESGQTIINALKDSDETMAQYLERSKDFIAYTQKDTEILTELGFQLDVAKVKLQRATVELAVNATPAIVALLDIIRLAAIPTLLILTSNIGLLKTVFSALIILLITKGILAFIQIIIQIRIAAEEQKKFVMWTLIAKSAVLGFVAVAGTIAGIAGMIAVANSELENFANTASEAYGGYGEDLGANIEQTATSMTETTTTVNVTVKAEGDTPISDENAQQIAVLTADELDRRWGQKVGK